MHKNEMWQLYYPNGEPILEEGWDSALGNPEETSSEAIVGVAIVFLYRFNAAGKLELLWQRRSELIDRYPGDYDISAGGHINLGESVVDGAMRECREEIGVEVKAEELQFAFTRSFNRNRFAWIFMVDWTDKEEDFRFNDEEVSEVKWVLYDDIEEFRKKYAKKPLRKDQLTFMLLDDWLKLQNILETNIKGN